jgi:hypothetical protein
MLFSAPFWALIHIIGRYLRGLAAAGMDYYQNSFEREAYALQSRFESAPDIPFSVEAAVHKSR